MINRKEAIKKKGFNMLSRQDNDAINSESQVGFVPVDFGKIKIGAKTLEDAVIDYGDFSKIDSRITKKENILNAIHKLSYGEMREISNFYYKTSGIYSRLCKYMAYMYRYD